MRGKPGANGAVVMGERIIPAHAGQTPRPRATPTARTDHPRACGANRRCAMVRQLAYGSSPRMRGKLSPTTSRYNFPRIIPAHAGQTAPYVHRTFCRADHPRACGANVSALSKIISISGSSPRMRGKRYGTASHNPQGRIIPAHAGQTDLANALGVDRSDHPRACGANRVIFAILSNTSGSSPRMRGKRHRRATRPRATRIIPAHAGQTPPLVGERAADADHPRACGANSESNLLRN